VKPMFACVAMLLAGTLAATAGPVERALAQLDPEERAHQACIILGIDKIRKDGTLPHADRMKTGVLGRATFSGQNVSTVGGAVRANHHWYRLKFDCAVTADQMKAKSFTYKIGDEIPRKKWDQIGLWP
jgi:Domain of Unknown Function (DUF930)